MNRVVAALAAVLIVMPAVWWLAPRGPEAPVKSAPVVVEAPPVVLTAPSPILKAELPPVVVEPAPTLPKPRPVMRRKEAPPDMHGYSCDDVRNAIAVIGKAAVRAGAQARGATPAEFSRVLRWCRIP